MRSLPRYVSFLTSVVLWIFLLEILFLPYVPDDRSHFSYVFGRLVTPFPNERRNTAPEIRKNTISAGRVHDTQSFNNNDADRAITPPKGISDPEVVSSDQIVTFNRVYLFDYRENIEKFSRRIQDDTWGNIWVV